MTQLYNLARVLCWVMVLALGTPSPTVAQCTTCNQTPTDGAVTASEHYSASALNHASNGSTTWYMTWDNTNLYIAIVGNNTADVAHLYFDINPTTTNGIPANNSGVFLPFNADVEVSVGSDATISYTRLAVNNGPGSYTWAAGTTPIALKSTNSTTTREVAIPWTQFYGVAPAPARPAAFNWQGYLTNTTSYGPMPAANSSAISGLYTYYFTVSNSLPSSASATPPFQQLSFSGTASSNAPTSGRFYDYTMTSAGPTITLDGDLTIDHKMKLRNRIVATGANTVILTPGATLDELESTNSTANGYILGKATTSETINAAQAYSFGNIGLVLTILPKATGPYSYPEVTQATRLTGQTIVGPRGDKSISRQFFIKPTNIANDNVVVKMDFFYTQDELNSLSEGQLVFFKSAFADPYNITLAGSFFEEKGRNTGGGVNAGKNDFNVSGLELQGIWTLGAKNRPLPVELTQFTGRAEPTGIQLRWTTASELTNNGFTVERQAGLGQWQPLGFVAGRGTTSQAASYAYLDREAPAGSTYYYRLHQTDTDGSSYYSPVVAVQVQAEGRLALSPVPASQVVRFHALAADAQSVSIYSAQGKCLLRQAISGSTDELSVEALPPGLYILQVTGRNSQPRQQVRFVKE